MKIIESERLLLRNWKDSDYLDFFEYASNPIIGTNTGSKIVSNIEDAKRIVNNYVKLIELMQLF